MCTEMHEAQSKKVISVLHNAYVSHHIWNYKTLTVKGIELYVNNLLFLSCTERNYSQRKMEECTAFICVPHFNVCDDVFVCMCFVCDSKWP